jgi:hypothetical protein
MWRNLDTGGCRALLTLLQVLYRVTAAGVGGSSFALSAKYEFASSDTTRSTLVANACFVWKLAPLAEKIYRDERRKSIAHIKRFKLVLGLLSLDELMHTSTDTDTDACKLKHRNSLCNIFKSYTNYKIPIEERYL